MTKKYTVLLLVPEEATLPGEIATFLAHVNAVGVRRAIHDAKALACAECESTPDAFEELLVIEGHHDDLLKQRNGATSITSLD